MPGRHSTSSDLGGGWGGGGVDFGGGWRPRGPWNPQPSGGGIGWGWLLTAILPFLFGSRFGRGGGGCGCGGGLGCLILICVIGVCVASGGFGMTRGNYTNYGGGYYGGSSGVAGQQTQTALDLSEMHSAFDGRIPDWEHQLASNEYHTISGPDAGLTQDNNTREVVYGKCGSTLYVFVVLKTRPDTGPADAEGYAYTKATSPASCRPPMWAIYDTQNLGGGWYFVTLKSDASGTQGRQ